MSGTGRGTGHKACLTLLVCWGVFFTQYANVAILAAFFPDSPFWQKVGAAIYTRPTRPPPHRQVRAHTS